MRIRKHINASRSVKASLNSAITITIAAAAKRFARRLVVVTAATYSYRNLTANMLCSLRKTGAPYVLISLDERMHAWALERNYFSVHIPTRMAGNKDSSLSVSNFGTQRFNQVTRDKVSAVVAVLSTRTDAIYVDSDAYFCSTTAIHKILTLAMDTDIDMVSQRSHVLHQPMNSGIYYIRSSRNTIKFLQEHIVENDEKHLDEQVLFNRILCKQGTVLRDSERYPLGCTSASHGRNASVSVHVRFLDAPSFPIGCTRLKGESKHIIEQAPQAVNELCRQGGIELLHYSCVEGDRKIHEMKRRGMWSIDEAGECPNT